MGANDRQVGGQHYQSNYQHWDLAIRVPMSYLEGNATRYVCRWRKKEGMQDLQKALHYVDKLIEVFEFSTRLRNLNTVHIHEEVNKFSNANNLSFNEKEFVLTICTTNSMDDLLHARELLTAIIEDAILDVHDHEEVAGPGTPEDGGHHAP